VNATLSANMSKPYHKREYKRPRADVAKKKKLAGYIQELSKKKTPKSVAVAALIWAIATLSYIASLFA